MTKEEKDKIKQYEDFLNNNAQVEANQIFITMRFIRNFAEDDQNELSLKILANVDDDSGFSPAYLLSFKKHIIAWMVIKHANELGTLGFMLRDYYLETFLFGYQLADSAMQDSVEGYAKALVDETLHFIREGHAQQDCFLEKAVLEGKVSYA